MASSLPSPPSSRPSTPTPAKSQSESLQKDSEDSTHQPVLAEAKAKTKTETVDKEQDDNNEEERISLSHRLDSLLECYLAFLDEYTRLREQLSKNFSSGFFSLAQANRNSALGPGRRYGEEGYDKRMKALKKVEINLDTPLPTLLENTTTGAGNKSGDSSATEKGTIAEPNPVTTPTSQTHKEDHHSTRPNEAQALTAPSNTSTLNVPDTLPLKLLSNLSCHSYAIKSTTITDMKDPLKWYGILVPPALRQSQARFSSSVASTIPRLLSTMSALESLDREIWRVRRELGLLDLYDLDHEYHHLGGVDKANDSDESRLHNHDATTATTGASCLLSSSSSSSSSTTQSSAPLRSTGNSGGHSASASGSSTELASSYETSSTTSKRQTLFSSSPQPSEPRSRLLKLD
ncbi:hypothetical protein ABEF95_010564 [Exophiala dermatitidis]